jgi:hypothetical protein
MPKAIIPPGYTASDRKRIFGKADSRPLAERMKEQKTYRRAKKAVAQANRAATRQKKKKK